MNENNMYEITTVRNKPEFILFAGEIVRLSLINEFTADEWDFEDKSYYRIRARHRDKVTIWTEVFETKEEKDLRFNELFEMLC